MLVENLFHTYYFHLLFHIYYLFKTETIHNHVLNLGQNLI